AGGGEQPADEVLRLVAVAELEESARAERGVAQPAEAIVPVEIAARPLGQGSRWSRNDGPRRNVLHQLEQERAAHDRLAVRSVVAGAPGPGAPERDSALEHLERADAGGRQDGHVM